MPTAAILSIGDELMLGQHADTNAVWLSAELAALGLPTIERRTVPDDQAAIAKAMRELAAAADVLISTGGLGPTKDDLTREALADLLTPGSPLVEDAAALADLERWFAGRALPMSPSNRRQALRPSTARALPNPHGTAPGLAGEHRNCRTCLVFALPGPPPEMHPMFRNHVAPTLRGLCEGSAEGGVLLTLSIAQIGLGESAAAERLGELMERGRNPSVGTTASGGVVSARLCMHAPVAEAESARRRLEEVAAEVEARWAPYVYGRDGATLTDAVAALLRPRRLTLSVAESCTGGLLGASIVDLAGSSDFFLGGFVTYSNALKHELLGVPNALLEKHGAVSEPVARSMAVGAMERSGSACSLAITGIAGPDGGTEEKPVGTVFIAVGTREGGETLARVRRFRFSGDRRGIRERATGMALQMLRLRLLEQDEAPLLWEVAGAGGDVASASR